MPRKGNSIIAYTKGMMDDMKGTTWFPVMRTVRQKLGISVELLAKKTGMDKEHLEQAEAGESSFKWSEYMSLLFVIWNNDIVRGIIEAKGLFRDVLKKAMSVNRNAHAPMTESAKFVV